MQDTTIITKALLICGFMAGPLYVISWLHKIFTPYTFTPQTLYLLNHESLGWIQSTYFLFIGVLTFLGAVGMTQALVYGRGSKLGPLCIALFGISLISAAIFVNNGNPAVSLPIAYRVVERTPNELAHMVSGRIGFLGLIAACAVFTTRFNSQKKYGWVGFSLLTGAILFFAFLGALATTPYSMLTTRVFPLTMVLGWIWISSLSIQLMRDVDNQIDKSTT